MKMRKAFLIAILVGALLLTVTSTALADASRHITWYVMSSGGGQMESPNYALDTTVGQPAVGLSFSPNYTLGSGFWYVVSVPRAARLFLPVLLKQHL